MEKRKHLSSSLEEKVHLWKKKKNGIDLCRFITTKISQQNTKLHAVLKKYQQYSHTKHIDLIK